MNQCDETHRSPTPKHAATAGIWRHEREGISYPSYVYFMHEDEALGTRFAQRLDELWRAATATILSRGRRSSVGARSCALFTMAMVVPASRRAVSSGEGMPACSRQACA